MKDDMIGIAKRDIKKGEEILIPLDGLGYTLPNEYMNFLETTGLCLIDGELRISKKGEKLI